MTIIVCKKYNIPQNIIKIGMFFSLRKYNNADNDNRAPMTHRAALELNMGKIRVYPPTNEATDL